MFGNHRNDIEMNMVDTAKDSDFQLNTVEEAIEDIRQGKVIIVVDDEDRENEGDFICAAECVTPEIINFMITHGRGLVCAPIDEKRADELDLPMMVTSNTALHETAFTVSIDLIGKGCTTGISAFMPGPVIFSLYGLKPAVSCAVLVIRKPLSTWPGWPVSTPQESWWKS